MVSGELKAYILEHFHYEDGKITRDDRKNSNGSLDKDGYLILKIKGKQLKAHRVAWLLNYGEFPEYELDHINRNRLDNRIENLRESNRFEQTQNSKKTVNKETGVVGVCVDKTNGLKKKYAFRFDNKTYRFYSVEDALKEKERLRNEQKVNGNPSRIKGTERAV
jgi:hypothetical protein